MRFVVVHQREPHARQLAFPDVPQPVTRDERIALARRTLAELRLTVDVWIDEGDASRAAFGALPNWAIVVDPAGLVHLKLPWTEPSTLTKALHELDADLPDPRPAPRDTGFLQAIAQPAAAGDPDARHDRWTMLAHLALTRPAAADRDGWLTELAGSGPPCQRQWAQRLRQATASRD